MTSGCPPEGLEPDGDEVELSALEEAAAALGVELTGPDVEQLDLMGGEA